MSEIKGKIMTFTGRLVDPFNMAESDICIFDIAASLSKQCRFIGHTDIFYSVGLHCINTSMIVSPENAMQALFHDASEAYLHDLAKPIKDRPEFGFYRHAEYMLQRTIYRKLGLSEIDKEEARTADFDMFCVEADLFMKKSKHWILPDRTRVLEEKDVTTCEMNSDSVCRFFIKRFLELARGKEYDGDECVEVFKSIDRAVLFIENCESLEDVQYQAKKRGHKDYAEISGTFNRMKKSNIESTKFESRSDFNQVQRLVD
jgi:hypothetical protein